ncbi:hypothetical protein [Aquimarina algiphila]|uniref:hypothetical protein n=1 Tax=Aquimarina algiphila TaxID=2047982 RepID=UPI00232BB001|nr:hypothetical protein [Aquimarina algiphila]
MNTNEKNEKFIEMNELCKILKAIDTRTAAKWCEDLNIPLMNIGKKKVAYRFLVEMELDKKIIQQLKKQYPSNWEDLYRHYQNNDRYAYITATEKESIEKTIAPKRKRGTSKFAQEFARE